MWRTRSGQIFLGGLVVAAVGLVPFFSGDLHGAELGIALVCIGLGLAAAVMVKRMGDAHRALAQGSRESKAWAVLLLPRTIILGVVAFGLIGFGGLMLGFALGVI